MSTGEKTEQPTSKKLRDARQKGQVATSKDVTSTALLVVIFVYFFARFDWMFENLREFVVLPAAFHGETFGDSFPQVMDATTEAFLRYRAFHGFAIHFVRSYMEFLGR